uniref:Thioredoxin n=1 Tax=Candidatus Kentrum sp. TC TaxID=2126339 RepID=A0A451AE80_9GAMM|nr:MAG: Thioredoxin [Candidatus Kentron sp. TC]VFK64328.1 MAG: Thioredoxin [Candidatus Kentron sp. TC]
MTAYREKNNVKVLMPEPVASVVSIDTQDAPMKGNPDAKVTIVEFVDYRCGYCKKAAAAIGKVMEKFEGKVQVVYMDFPILGPDSRTIAEGEALRRKPGEILGIPRHGL